MTHRKDLDLPDAFDFEAWAELAATDVEAFERARETAIRRIIDDSPMAMRQRLKGLQWRIDQVRRQSGSPVGACVRLSQMMWETLLGTDGLIGHIERLTDPGHAPERPSAAVLPFRGAGGGAGNVAAPDGYPGDGGRSPVDEDP